MSKVDPTFEITEIFWSVCGEGVHAGIPTAFLRFGGCNLSCPWCDEKKKAHRKMSLTDIVNRVSDVCVNGRLVITGGEPMLQLDVSLLKALTERGVTFIALETNGTLPISPSIKKFLDWITVSPKTGLNNLAIKRGDELKVVFPECASTDLIMAVDTELRFSHYLIQPCYGPALTAYTEQAVEFVLKYPRWRISTQMQRIWRIR